MTSAQEKIATNPITLNQNNLEKISNFVPVPSYDRNSLSCGIVHMSVGGFHRSHQAVYTNKFLEKFPSDWMICGIGLLPNDKDNIEALQKQDGLYTVIERSAKEDKAEIIGSMKEALHAPSDPQKVLAQLIDPKTRIVSLTITEKGYACDTSGNLDPTNPFIKTNLDNPNSPTTAYGYLYLALRTRKEKGEKPFTIMSCDNLPGNGHLTHKLVLQYVELLDKDLAKWIDDNVAFPNAMVDRITPITTQAIIDLAANSFSVDDKWPVVCEDYIQWVLEDNFCNGRPEFEKVGVQLVADVDPYEKMKVRLLNGSHSALAYLSYLMGYRAVDKAMNDPLISKFVRAYMDADVTPCVPEVPGVDLDAYKDKLIERFANPAVSDQVQRLAEDGSTKLPNSIVPCILHQLKTGGSTKHIALALAGWFIYMTAKDEDGQPIEIKDAMKDKLVDIMQKDPMSPDNILAVKEIFGSEIPKAAQFVAEIKEAMESLATKGAKQTLEDYLA